MSKQQIGVIGLAVMGKNLALNIESRGFTVSVYNRSKEKTGSLYRKRRERTLWELTLLKSLLIHLKLQEEYL
jgi:6-phosphogluconate dehydrogenase